MLGALALMGAGVAAKSGLDWVKGKINNSAYADRIRDQADLQYLFAERYAKNSPSWNIEGLRRAGLNPVLAVSNGVNLGANVPNLSASSPDTDSGSAPDFLAAINLAKQNDLLDAQIDGQKIRNRNEEMNRGLTGQYGAYSRLLSEVQERTPSVRPFDWDKVQSSIRSFLDSSPKTTEYNSSVRHSEDSAIRRAYEDVPPSMREHNSHVITDGFDSRVWSRSRNKKDGSYRYQRRNPISTFFIK